MEFYEGYKKALSDFDKFLNESIKRNGGLRTHEHAWRVASDVIMFTRIQEARIKGELNDIFGGNE